METEVWVQTSVEIQEIRAIRIFSNTMMLCSLFFYLHYMSRVISFQI